MDTAGLNSLIQQVQGYGQLGASFDGAQGGIFGARFDNELLSGTLKADTATALQALQDIVNNGGTVSATDAAQLTAAGFGYVADAQDVSGNNAPNGGGTYVGRGGIFRTRFSSSAWREGADAKDRCQCACPGLGVSS